MTETRVKRSDRFLRALEGKRPVVVTHDNPDPDAIASGWGLVAMLKHLLNVDAPLMGRGAIVRAENLHMMRLLRPPLELVNELPADDVGVILVDCEPTAANHPVDPDTDRLIAVIDHHERSGPRVRLPFQDIRPRAAASSTMVAGYWREQELEPAPALATAMLYAVRTELVGRSMQLTRSDRGLISWLSGFADYAKLAEIESAPLQREYFCDLVRAFESTDVHEEVAVCFLPQASGSEVVGEVADLLIRCQGIRKVLCGALINDSLVLSARTAPEGGAVLPLLRATIRSFGACGGHRHRAGGRIPSIGADPHALELLLQTVRTCWLSACGVSQASGRRLLASPTGTVEAGGGHRG